MKLGSTDRELRSVNQIACRHVCFVTSPHRRHETSRFRRLPRPPSMVPSLTDGPVVNFNFFCLNGLDGCRRFMRESETWEKKKSFK